MSRTSFSRSLLFTFQLLLFTLLTLSALTPLNAESSLYIKANDDQVRATERLSDFLEEIGYSVDYSDEDKDMLIIHQQGHNIFATVLFVENQYKMIRLEVCYKFNPNAGTAASRALAANRLNAEQAGVKVVIDEPLGGLCFEYTLPFESFVRPSEFKRFADQALMRSYVAITHDDAFRKAIRGEQGSDETDSPDSATNADEVAPSETSDDDATMTETEAHESAATKPSVKPESEPETKPAPAAKPGSEPATKTKPAEPSKKSDDEDDDDEEEEGEDAAPAPSAAPADTAPPASPATTASPATPTLAPALPPTTPAAPARTKRARA